MAKSDKNDSGVDLVALIQEIKAGHKKCLAAARTTLDSARLVGNLLLRAKAAVGHGNWSTWVTKNCCFGIREAQRYIKVAKSAEALEQEGKNLSKMTLTDVLDCLANKSTAPESDSQPHGEQVNSFQLAPPLVKQEWAKITQSPPALVEQEEKDIQKWIETRMKSLYAAIRNFAIQKSGAKGASAEATTLALEVYRRLSEGLHVDGLFGEPTPQTDNRTPCPADTLGGQVAI